MTSSSQLLYFLQAGLDLGLGLSTLKVQVAAISAMTNNKWAKDPLVVQFFKAVKKISSVRQTFSSWDLIIVLEALSNQPFAPSEVASLWNLTLKLASGKRVSELQVLEDDNHIVFLTRVDGFIPKASSSSNISEPWALPAFSDQDSGALHKLNIASVPRHYLQATAAFRS